MIGYRKSVQFAYNPNNELKQTITIIDTGLQVQKTTTSYFYDAFGRRIAKSSRVERLHKLNQKGELVRYPTALLHLRKTDKTTHQSTLMLWEGNRQLQEYTDQFIFTTVYDQDSFEAVARVVQSRQAQDKTQGNTQGNDNDKVELFKIYHYHNNHLGTPQELTDENGEVVWCNYEWAWGGRYTHFYKEQSLNGCAILEHELQPIRFQGQFFDTETSLHYNRFRYYDTDVGMFISRDPIGLLGGINIFQYADNPVMWIDPLGLSCIELDSKGKPRDSNFPYGKKKDGTPRKKSGPKTDPNAPHNKKIAEIGNRVEAEGGQVIAGGAKGVPEAIYNTRGGIKDTRRPDVLYRDKNGVVRGINVGKAKKDGSPIKREQQALDDLNNFGGLPTTFESYN